MKTVGTSIVPESAGGMRFSDYAREAFGELSTRKGIKKAIKRGEILVDGAPADTGLRLRPGQRIDFVAIGPAPGRTYHLPLRVLHEDEWIAVVDKPAGIPVRGNAFKTVERALPGVLASSREPDALACPDPVHRLDVPVSGLLLVAKTARARAVLGRRFEEREIAKRYRAVVMGKIEAPGRLAGAVGGRDAVTDYLPLRSVPSIKNGWLTLVELRPLTGRTHQLRVQMAEAGFPILGDARYGPPGRVLRGKGLFLCAVGLAFRHPVNDGPLEINIQEPEKFGLRLDRESRMWERHEAGDAGSST